MTGYYNGYGPKERGRIVPYYRKLTGKKSPFEGKPCAMCGDPDRSPHEWHCEDYSEPFGFGSPQSYPLCKPCHSRLHKRFKAQPGEWALFCQHLDSGGYGREFTELYSADVRRVMCGELLSGRPVDLKVIRARPQTEAWWRDLTLDPESLFAPWARPRPLRPRPSTEAYLAAFKDAKLSENEVNLLLTHAQAPKRTASMRTLASLALTSDQPKTANLIYCSLARRLTSLLDWEPDKRADGSPIWMSLLAEGWTPPAREYELTMVPTAAEAVVVLIEEQARV